MGLLENISKNEDIQNYMTENEILIQIMDDESNRFKEKIKGFILANPQEFIDESVDEIKKNILTFSEAATAQYMKEVSTIIATHSTSIDSTVTEGVTDINDTGIDDYL